jgi:hypothetical protein
MREALSISARILVCSFFEYSPAQFANDFWRRGDHDVLEQIFLRGAVQPLFPE